uniref:Variant erythrocyte surface antigen-beta subunit n=1 Tax=Babesia bovis TaxID=5865 RepID=S6BPQ7_BABBO|nr:variant erythrocyte surface antigen- beta subunit [Babesia bovis]
MNCTETIGKDLSSGKQSYPEIEDHMNMQSPFHPNGHLDNQHRHCPVPMGWKKETDFKDLNTGTHKTAALDKAGTQKYPVHCTGNTLSQ